MSFDSYSASVNNAVPPVAPVRQVREEYFGTTVLDPYRWMEEMKGEEMGEWLRGQAEYADAYLQGLPLREEILERLREVTGASVMVRGVRSRGERFLYLRRAPDEEEFRLYVRDGLEGEERLLIDPNSMVNDGQRYSIVDWSISFDGVYVSCTIAAGGSEQADIYIVDVATGTFAEESIPRANFSSGEWLPDGRSFLYNRLQFLSDDAPATEKYQRSRVYLHVLGTDPETDRPIFGCDLNPDLPFDPALIPFVETDPNWNVLLGSLHTGVSPNKELYVAPLESLNNEIVPWRKAVSFDDEVADWGVRGDDLYLLTYHDAPRYKIVRTSLSAPDLPNAESIVPAGEAVITRLAAQRDALYVQTFAGNDRQIVRVDYETKEAEPLDLPYNGAPTIAATESSLEGIYLNLVSWTASNAHFRYDPKRGSLEPTGLIPPSPIDMSGIEVVNAGATSHDGVEVPLVIVHKKGLKRDGTSPTLMDGYGAYGVENISPFFDTRSLPWLERGGIVVWTGVRGGGEYGEEWHRGGFGKTKPNTWKDFIACAEYLIAENYTSPSHLGIRGGSAGGILIGNAIAERPELFGAAVISVGLNNPLRAETTSNGVPNIPEFGTFTTEEGFRNLLAMDCYHKIEDGAVYPAVLLTHGINDPRVEPWMSAKMAARLQAGSSSGKPVLFRIDYDAGHGLGSTNDQFNREMADVFAFLFQQLL